MQTPLTRDHDQTPRGTARKPSKSAQPVSRRRVLRLVGGAGAVVAVAAVGGGIARAVDQGVFSTGEGAVYAAWSDVPATDGENPLSLVQAAILAANAHNTQPWLFRVEESGINLYADTTRGTGANDPLGRELMVSLGCALENLMVAAGPNGFATTLTLLPNPADATHVARVDLTPATPAVSALYDAIPDRHTNHAAFEDTPLAPEVLSMMADLNDDADVAIVWLTSPEAKLGFSELTIAATEAFIADTEQSVDSFAWWRGDWDELQRRKDGITMDAAGLPALTRALGKIMPDLSRSAFDESWLKCTRDPQLSSAAAFGVIVA